MTKFVLVLNTKKAELAKLKQQIEQSTTDNGNKPLPIHTEYSTNKRTRDEISDGNTSEDEIEKPTQSKLKVLNNNQDSSLDLGNDQIDYKTSTINKHHQRRKYVTDTNSISTRPFIHHTSSSISTPSLPDDSQTTDDLLNKI